MLLPLIAVLFLLFITLGYFVYGSWVARQFGLDPAIVTPAHIHKDGTDYLPTNPFYLFGQHFSAIAAAGPIAGPIVACQQFGWLPSLLWISLGVVFIGAVHDFSTLTCSVRHHAHSIADITREQLGSKAGKAMMLFIWIALVYIIVAFADITASSFVSSPEELQNLSLNFHPGGAVAWASMSYLILSILLGLVERYLKTPLWLNTMIFVPATYGLCWAGTYFSHWFQFSQTHWALLICLYCAIASLIPVWLLLQPRGYLGGYVLYSVLVLGVVGLFFSGKPIVQPTFTGFHFDKMTGSLFPFLFVTIACGACSGFHGLVCSGTTSKQIDKETHLHAVGYGAMLAEGFVALISLGIIMMMAPADVVGMKPGSIYGKGIGEFLAMIIGKEHLPFAMTFGAMAFSTFVFDTLDVSTRLGRYLVEELTGLSGKLGAILGTLLTIMPSAIILMSTETGMWSQFWTLFGAANQLLAALTLLVISVWLHKNNKRLAFTLIPMAFVLVTTMVALIQLTRANLEKTSGLDISLVNSVMSIALIGLSIYLVGQGMLALRTKKLPIR
ncbi:MAG TPA: carbon starvation CstA family protein [Bacteriovoracaceae bacterium]|nr:carbon starvation CstA family protein [Bacteriovoracaceae bacterium]